MAIFVAAVLATAAVAAAAVQPNGGSGFTSSTEGWTSRLATCQPSGGAIGEQCSATNSLDLAVGNPKGSLRSRLTVDLGFVLFDSDYTWRSPSFTVPGDPEAPVSGAEFSYDRRFSAGDLINLGPRADVEATLIDETGGGEAELIEETLDANDDSFEKQTAGVVAGSVVRGHRYHIELHTAIATTSTASSTSGSRTFTSTTSASTSRILPETPRG